MIRTDLAMEAVDGQRGQEIPGVSVSEDDDVEGIHRVRVRITSQEGEQALGKKQGMYITLEAAALAQGDKELDERCAKALADELRGMGGGQIGDVLVVGLGNRMVTPDALGPAVADRVFVTRHIHEYAPNEIDERLGKVSAISPGVLGITGVETGEVIEGVVKRINPSLIIAVDSLASRSMGRIRTTIQIADTGISPGAGVGNKRKAIDLETLGVPVIALGVPLVVYASTVAQDLVASAADKAGLSGEESQKILGAMMDAEGADMIVTPKEIDKVVDDLARVIADALNIALHDGISIEETRMYMH